MPLRALAALLLLLPALLSLTAGPAAADAASQPCDALIHRDWTDYAAPSGTVRAAMVFVDYSDAPGHAPTEQAFELFGQADDWYAENSFGQMRLEITPVPGWQRMSKPSTDYGLSRGDGTSTLDYIEYAREALALADPAHDFSGTEILYVVSSDGAAQDYSPAHFALPEDGLSADGAELTVFSTLGGDIYDDDGADASFILAHETGHLFGLPDYYVYGESYERSHRHVGPWDLMGELFPHRHMMAWTKYRLGWLGDGRSQCLATPSDATYTLQPTTRDGLVALVVPTGRSAAYVLEARHPEGFDASICDGGLLLSQVDEQRSNAEGPLRVVPAGPGDSSRDFDCGQLNGAPFVAGGTYQAPDGGFSMEVASVSADGAVTVRVITDGLDSPSDGDAATTERIDGGDAAAVALAVSRDRFGDGEAGYAVLSRDDDFADSLAGAALSARGPLLFTPSDRLADPVGAELRRAVTPGGTVYLLGGERALRPAVAAAIEAEGLQVRRLAGPSRVETAVAVAREVQRRFNVPGMAVVARAGAPASSPTAGWADSVTGGSWAAAAQVPVLLTPSDTLHPAVADWLQEARVHETILLGGRSALSDAVELAVPGPRRVSGSDRAATAVAVATDLFGAPANGARRFLIGNGYHTDGWAYGLAAAGLAADHGMPLLLTDTQTVPPATAGMTGGCQQVELVVVGGAGVVGPEAVSELDALDASGC